MNSYKSLISYAKKFADELNKNSFCENVVIEIGNSCRVMHLGAIRQMYLAFELKDILKNFLPQEINVEVHYFESDGLPPLLSSSRGITLNMANKKIFFTFGLNKKLPVLYQQSPKLKNLQKTSDSIKSFLLASKYLREKYSKEELIDSIYEMNSLLMDNFKNEDKRLHLWYRRINERILRKLDLSSPKWKINSSIIKSSNTKEENNLILDTLKIIKSKLNYWPIWIFDPINKSRKRVPHESDINELISNQYLDIYPDVILRQALSCRKYSVINIHGNNYDYQLKINKVIKEMNISKRIIYDAKVSSNINKINPLSNSIDWFNILLDKKYDKFKNQLKKEDLFMPIRV